MMFENARLHLNLRFIRKKEKRICGKIFTRPQQPFSARGNSFTAEELSHWFFQQSFLTNGKKTIHFLSFQKPAH